MFANSASIQPRTGLSKFVKKLTVRKTVRTNIGLLIYIWACVGVQIITTQKDGFEGEAKDVVDYYFYDLYSTMRSLIQFINFDDSSSLYTPLMQSKPYLSIFFISFMMVVGLAVILVLYSGLF